jgi:7-cyano-7-deazaguanine synthase|tara:strand:+ start:1107 stop:1790 length:684 start_codon:yes stop_codon:yes gene_type:complete
MKKTAVILLSGGLDSTTCVAIAKDQGFELYGLTINYGQKHIFELESAKSIASYFDIKNHSIIDINLAQFGGSALTSSMNVPKNRNVSDMNDIPVTYVPARNTVFLSIALARAETINAFDIFIGVNALDYSGYPDCRPAFISEFEKLANLATKNGVEKKGEYKIHTPLISLTKSEIITKGIGLNVDYSITSSCYDPSDNGYPCGLCDACQLRLKGFKEAGLKDPLVYI